MCLVGSYYDSKEGIEKLAMTIPAYRGIVKNCVFSHMSALSHTKPISCLSLLRPIHKRLTARSEYKLDLFKYHENA